MALITFHMVDSFIYWFDYDLSFPTRIEKHTIVLYSQPLQQWLTYRGSLQIIQWMDKKAASDNLIFFNLGFFNSRNGDDIAYLVRLL